jgi:large subunit ribosomal protein L18
MHILKKLSASQKSRFRRKHHIRKKIFGAQNQPRLSIFKSNKYIYIQAINDFTGDTIASFSSISNCLNIDCLYRKQELSFIVGKLFGKKLMKMGVYKGSIDRNGFSYSKRLSKLVDGIRESGFYV